MRFEEQSAKQKKSPNNGQTKEIFKHSSRFFFVSQGNQLITWSVCQCETCCCVLCIPDRYCEKHRGKQKSNISVIIAYHAQNTTSREIKARINCFKSFINETK